MFSVHDSVKVLVCIVVIAAINASGAKRPHIIFIIADDLGWNDLGFHGSSQIPTPNIDALAYSGVILNNYYVTPICTPSRAALMTGKYPIHTGMQHTVLYAAEPRGLPLNETLLPEYLQTLGYKNHIVGKWHLGHYKRAYTPLYRGFLSHTGFWSGRIDYYDHTSQESGTWGLDMRRNLDVAYDLHGKYTTHIITDEAVRRINTHNVNDPLFLYIAHGAVHSGNPYSPLPAPDITVQKMDNITNYNRRKYAAITNELDDSVGHVVAALGKRNMLENSIIIFTTDNGGPAAGFNFNAASNWPLRGVKNTLWEGGVRGAGLIWSPLIDSSQRVSNQTLHIVDWLPTLLSAAGGDNISFKSPIDGIDSWAALSKDGKTARKDILHNIDDIYGSASVTVGDWKVMKGTNYNGEWDDWYGPAGERDEESYQVNDVCTCPAGKALTKLNMLPPEEKILTLRKEATVVCDPPNDQDIICEPLKAPCLFNILEDPCERNNLAKEFPEELEFLLARLEEFNKTALKPGNLPNEPRADPKFWNNVWTNFGDYLVTKPNI